MCEHASWLTNETTPAHPARPERPASGAAAAWPDPAAAPDARGEARKNKSVTSGAQHQKKKKTGKKEDDDDHQHAVGPGLGGAGLGGPLGGGPRSSAQAAKARCCSRACAGKYGGRAERPFCGIAGADEPTDEASFIASLTQRPDRSPSKPESNYPIFIKRKL